MERQLLVPFGSRVGFIFFLVLGLQDDTGPPRGLQVLHILDFYYGIPLPYQLGSSA